MENMNYINQSHTYNHISTTLREVVYDLRIQNYVHASRRLSELFTSVTNDTVFISGLIDTYGKDAVMENLAGINEAFNSKDWILTADMLEQICIPVIESMSSTTSPQVSGNYVLESTPSGYMTVKSLISGSYIHSAVDPMWEAEQLAKDMYDAALRGYIIWGCGLGYFALKLVELTNGSVPIRIYEEDPLMIELAKEYGYSQATPGFNAEIIHDPNAQKFTSDLADHLDYGLMVHLPSVKKIENTSVKDALFNFYRTNQEPVRRYSTYFKRNYFSNLSLGLDPIDMITDRIKEKEVVIVAAGPSLDDSLEFLKESNNRIVICVGTVLRKLLNLSINPNYCVFLDPYETTYKQIEGLTNCQIPMILGMSTYWKIGQDYKGPKMLAITKGLTGVPNVYKDSHFVFDVKSSVITLALDIAMQMSASSVYLVGTDLAYKDGMSHASGTPRVGFTPESELLPAKGTSGKTVYTTILLNEMREWIEKEIKKYPQIPVYNLSKTGAMINGTRPFTA